MGEKDTAGDLDDPIFAASSIAQVNLTRAAIRLPAALT
jgi:hypothetical protein